MKDEVIVQAVGNYPHFFAFVFTNKVIFACSICFSIVYLYSTISEHI